MENAIQVADNDDLERSTRTTGRQRPIREGDGWRRGRPVEDPDKTKRWGFVNAKPSEFLIHCRRGSVLPSSGQGASCFKWPSDAVAVVPTSLQRLQFSADQITLERVGVQVTGLAVYRIADPMLAFRVLNFSYPERAQEKLRATLTEMLVGSTRRLVANLGIDECLQKRKAALADELLREIAPVIGGTGHPNDPAGAGWGVVLDTVEIQEVRILSSKVFDAMQAPFRSTLDRQAREARAGAEKESAKAEAASRREIELATIESQAAVRERRAGVERAEAQRKSGDGMHLWELQLQEEQARIENLQRRRTLALDDERDRVDDVVARKQLSRREAQAEIAEHDVLAKALEVRAELARVEWEAVLRQRTAEAECNTAITKKQADAALDQALAEDKMSAAKARLLMAQNLPDVAAAVGGNFGDVKVTHIGEGSPFSTIAHAVASVMELAKNA